MSDSDYYYGKKVISKQITGIKEPTIVIYLNGTCFTCIHRYSESIKLANSLKERYDVRLLSIVYTYDSLQVKHVLSDFKASYGKLYFQDTDSFIKKNKLTNNSFFHFMLLDKDMKIVEIGDPSMKRDLYNKYEKKLDIIK